MGTIRQGISQACTDAKRSVIRFPLSIFSAVVAAFFLGKYFHSTYSEQSWIHDYRWALTAIVGISAATLATLWGESRNLPRSVNVLIASAFCLCEWLLAIHWIKLNIPDQEFVLRMIQLALVLHLAVAYLPAVKLSPNGFWQYNRFWFRRVLLIAIYALIIYLGLVCALSGATYLLDLKVRNVVYSDLFVLCFVFYHPCVCLGGFPEIKDFEAQTDFPSEIAVLSKYILLPLVALYGVILYLYLAKIMVMWELPRGGVGYLVSTVSVIGLLCFLLLEPAIIVTNSRLQRVRSIFFFLLFPLIFLLFLGLKVRIGSYGFTVPRYLLTAYGVWILGIAVYFLSSKIRNIKVIPSTLAVVALFTLIGPWSAYELPPWLQLRSLEGLLTKQGLLKDGRATKGDRVQNPEVSKVLRDKVTYLLESRQRGNLLKWFLDDNQWEIETAKSFRDGYRDENLRKRVLDQIGITAGSLSDWTYFTANYRAMTRPFSVKGYDYFALAENLNQKDGFRGEYSGTRFTVFDGKKVIAVFDLKKEIEASGKGRNASEPIEMIAVEGTAKLFINRFSAKLTKGEWALSSVGGEILFR